MTTHRLSAGPETVRIGMFDAAFPAQLEVQPGDSVVIECVSGHEFVVAGLAPEFTVPPALTAIHAAKLPRLGAHIITGPVAIAGAEPGDMLEVRIDQVELGSDWGYCALVSLMGTLPEDFPGRYVSHIAVDRARRVCKLPWGPDLGGPDLGGPDFGGPELALSPFFGVMGVAPPPIYGTISTREPREHGGNLDNKELVAGTTLYLPVFVPGAHFSAGDGHGVQGDGEVCINALEMSLTGTFTFLLHKGGGAQAPMLRHPRAETPTHYISMGMNADLDLAMKQALREMIAFICERTGWQAVNAYQSCSMAVDFHVTQNVNGEKGVHGMLRKGVLF